MPGGESIESNTVGPERIKGGNIAFKISVYDYQERIMTGRVERNSDGKARSFSGLLALIEFIQSSLDEGWGPGSTTVLRSWAPKEDARPGTPHHSRSPDPVDIGARPLARFLVHIHFRQNASWQGTVSWLEQRQSLAFRSVLELSSLLDGAVQQAATGLLAAPAVKTPHKWNARESVS